MTTATSFGTALATATTDAPSAEAKAMWSKIAQVILDNGVPGPAGAAGLIAPVQANCTTDVALGSDSAFADLATVTATGTAFLVHAHLMGVCTGTVTARVQVLIDGVAHNYNTTYGTSPVQVTGAAVGADITFYVSGLSAGSHTFKAQGSYGTTGSLMVHAASNPLREGAWIIVTPAQ